MRQFAAKVVSAVAPVFGVVGALALMRSAGIAFPPPLEPGAWAQWAVFAALVYCCTALSFYGARLVSGAPRSAETTG